MSDVQTNSFVGVDIVFGSVGGAVVVVCIGVARVDFDRLAIIFNRPVDLVVGAISDAAIVIVIGVVRVDFDRLGEVCDAAWSPLALNELCGRSTHSPEPLQSPIFWNGRLKGTSRVL